MSKPIQQCSGHFSIAEHLRPFLETQICSHNQGDLLIEFTDKMEEQGAPVLRKGEITQFIQDDQVYVPSESFSELTGTPEQFFLLQAIGEIDDIKIAGFVSLLDSLSSDGNRKMGFACTGATDQYDVAFIIDKLSDMESINLFFRDRTDLKCLVPG